MKSKITRFWGLPIYLFACIFMGVALLAPNFSYAQIVFTSITDANGLPTNDVRGVAAVGSNIYAATGLGFALSTDGGASWTTKTVADGLGSDNTSDVFLDGSTIYVATLAGLSVSTDGGNSFTNITLPGFYFENLVFDVFVEGTNVYAATAAGLSISNDGGSSFTLRNDADGLGVCISSCSPSQRFARGVVASGSDVYVATDGGLGISNDGGTSFTNYTLGDGLANVGANGVTLSGSTVYTASEGFATVGGLSITNNNGASFTVIQSPPLAGNSVNNVFAVGPNVYVGTSSPSISVSNDAAATFTVYDDFPEIPGITTDIYVDGKTVYVATSGGIAVGVDNDCVDCVPPVPTMGQWGLILLGLLLLSFGTVALKQQQLATAGSLQTSVSLRNLPFNASAYTRWLAIVGAALITVFVVSITLFGYEMTNADVPGSLLSIPVAAYLLHLLFGKAE